MTITITSGQTKDNLTISSGNPLIVLSGGTVGTSTVLSGGSATLSSGANGIDLTVSQGGVLLGQGDLNGPETIAGLVSGVTLAENANVNLLAGGTARGVTNSGLLNVDPGATATGVVIAGNLLVMGSASDGVVKPGGNEAVYSGGVVSGDIVQSNGFLTMLSGATAIDETVKSGGYFTFAGTLSKSFTLQSSPLTSTETLSGVTVSSGGNITMETNTLLSGVTLSLDTGAETDGLTVSRGGVVLGSGGELLGPNSVAGSISGVTVIDLGSLELTSGGSASGVTLIDSQDKIYSGASATGTIVQTDADLRVLGSEAGAVIESDGGEIVYSGGTASGDAVQDGGRVVVSSGGVASGANVTSGGLLYVLAAGTTRGTVVSVGGKELVASGGVADATTVLSGGSEYVDPGSLDNHGVVSSGGAEAIYSGGTAGDLTLISGGRLTDDGQVRVAGAGTLAGDIAGSGTIVELGGGDLLLSGGGAAFSGRAVISGGTIELGKSGQLGTGSVVFVEPSSGSAVLQIDAGDAPAAGGTFANVISNFSGANEDIDLRSIAFVAGASATVVGSTLTLSDGGKTYKFTLAGTIAGAYPVLSDGHGGTLIDPKAALFAQTAAAFAPSDAAKTALVSSTSPAGQTPLLHAAAGHP